jgi:hypothetical protein
MNQSKQLLSLFFWTSAIMLSACCVKAAKLTPRVSKLVEEAKTKNSAIEAGILSKNPMVAADIPEALEHIKSHPDFTSYHLLVAIRKYYPKSYKEVRTDDKVSILCSALRNIMYLNDWGYLAPVDSYDRESGKALLETGRSALNGLTPILDDENSAPLFGSEEATLSKLYKYRRKDFAYRYISLIIGESPGFSRNLKERDKRIEILKNKLKK